MDFLALVTDYDGTLAKDGIVSENTLAALTKLKESGRKAILVTGRVLEDLLHVFPRVDLFESVVAENGAVLYSPETRESQLLSERVPPGFPEALSARGVSNIGFGQCIVSTWRPHECAALDVLRDLGLDRQIIFNKNAVMILPTGVNKASGLKAALKRIRLSPHNVVGIGDAENDLPMLALCECGVAVSNALESVKTKADLVTTQDHGAGVEMLIARLLEDDLNTWLGSSQRRGLVLGKRKDTQHDVTIPSLGSTVLVAGPSGSGKSTAIAGLIERIAEAEYQLCLIDPEGDYEAFEPAVTLGNPHYVPAAEEIVLLLQRMHNVVVNLLGVSLDARSEYVSEIIRKLEHLRTAKGRPHWFLIDEAHHIFLGSSPLASTALPHPPATSLMITVHPNQVSREALARVKVMIAVGKDPEKTLFEFCNAAGIEAPHLSSIELEGGEVLIWFVQSKIEPFIVKVEHGRMEHKRHTRMYAQGDLQDKGFVFRGRDGKLNLAAQNLENYVRIGRGVDDDTWVFHLRGHHYSQWIRNTIKNDELAAEVENIETQNFDPKQSRDLIFSAIRAKYTLPA
jgi:hydroxymethylpyrimidine pyrophosphatase-like HAD family hydrolase